VTLCGEMAGRPLSAMALLGLGFRSVSMSPASIGPIKAMLLGLDVDALAGVMNDALDRPGPGTGKAMPMREVLKRFAETNNIPL
jgi:phosphotransferase system enzyme I (PtsP)